MSRNNNCTCIVCRIDDMLPESIDHMELVRLFVRICRRYNLDYVGTTDLLASTLANLVFAGLEEPDDAEEKPEETEGDRLH